MHYDYWKLQAHQLRAERDKLASDVLFWKGCAALLLAALVGLVVNLCLI